MITSAAAEAKVNEFDIRPPLASCVATPTTALPTEAIRDAGTVAVN